MSEDNNVPNCKQRFKAIEGFFRRVAFNLGNSPSQTEVKIISCIPIDVTDLQQKIFQLQRELEEAKNTEKKDSNNKIASVVHTAIGATCPTCNTRYEEQADFNEEVTCNDRFCHDSSFTAHADWPDTSSRQQRSTVSFLCPSVSSRKYPFFQEATSNKVNTEKSYKPSDYRRKLFSRKKKRCKYQFVCCAQTDTKTPFFNPLSKDATSKFIAKEATNTRPLGASYLENITQRQYTAMPVLDTFSNLSELSTPICRDNDPTCSQIYSCEPDLCSCCRGQFHNIDYQLNHRNECQTYPNYDTAENYKRNSYYDSNLYDLVPVKENPVRIKNIIETKKRREPKPQLKFKEAKLWSEDVRSKRVVPSKRVITNFCVYPTNYCPKKHSSKSYDKRDAVLNIMAAKRDNVSPSQPNRDVYPSKICSVDFGPVYSKQVAKKNKDEITIANKNDDVASCLPAPNNTSTNQDTASARADNIFPENKTEDTLNQIKNILQTVLREVKINSKIGKTPELEKKDAVVQNGPSHTNMFGTSHLLQSYTYSPYNIDPYIASCSRQIPNNSYTFPGMPGRPMQQYPLIIQPQKHMCSWYRNTHVNTTDKPGNKKRAACAATNTEHTEERSEETKKLIKEIYKSMALDIDIPSSKDNTVGRYTKLKPTEVHNSINMYKIENDEKSKHVAVAISEIYRNPKPLDSSNTKNTDTTLESSQLLNEASKEKERFMKNRRIVKKIYRCSPNDNSTTETIDTVNMNQTSRELDSDELSDATVVEKGNGTDSDTETDDVVINIKESAKVDETKIEKSSIFNKMLKMFKPKQNRGGRRHHEDTVKQVQLETESDSDDYQTVYSQKVVQRSTAPRQKRVVAVRSRPHSKVFYSKQLQQRRSKTKSPDKIARTSPYMEQEYRRYWQEKLMFHENQAKKRYSADTYRSATVTPRSRRPLYYQNYEARTALVQPNKQMPMQIPSNALKPRHVQNPMSNAYTAYDQYGHKHSEIRSNYPERHLAYLGQRANNLGNRTNYSVNNNFEGNGPNHGRNSNYPKNISSGRPHFITTKSGQRSMSSKGLSWLKKRKLQCGQQWKELIVEG